MPLNTQASEAEQEIVDSIVRRRGSKKDELVQILREVQAETRWLSRGVIAQVALGVGLTPAVVELAELIRAREPVENWLAQWQRVDDQVRRADVLLKSPAIRGDALRATPARGSAATLNEIDTSNATLDEIESSNLRGRGGAGFGVANKWRACLQAPTLPDEGRVVICNADEGEPGTFKDRVLLTRQADAVFEGMTVAARLIGATTGLVYLRGEYRYLLESLQSVLAQRRRDRLLGRQILDIDGFDFDIDIHLGAGAYICGEESSLIESLEGKRGTPRIRPPFPVERGYLGRPTVVNNVETFCAAAHIAERGGT